MQDPSRSLRGRLARLRPDRSRRVGALIPRGQGALLPRETVQPFRSRDVTTAGPEAPCAVDVEPIWVEVRRMYATGLHPAIALHVVHQGRVVLDRTVGHLCNDPDGRVGAQARPDSLFNLFSASKIVTATLVQALVDDGVLDLQDRVTRWIPAFGQRGKGDVRLRNLLDHTAGIPDMPRGFDLDAALDAGRPPLEALCALRPRSEPGRRVAYSPVATWFLVQEIIERATGRGLRGLLRERLLDPLGIETLDYGVSPDRLGDVARHAVTGPPVPGVMASVFDRSIGLPFADAVALTNDPRFLTGVLPSANVIGTPRDTGRFLQLLLGGGKLDGTRVLSEAAVARMTSMQTPRQLDGTFGMPMKYGLGVMMGGKAFSLFGLDTRGAFGHLGLSTVVVYADPARDLSVVFLNTGKPMADLGMARWYWVLQRIAGSFPRR